MGIPFLGLKLLLVAALAVLSSCTRGARTEHLTLTNVASRGEVTVLSPKESKGPLPLVVVLHGYASNAWLQSIYFGFDRYVAEKKFHLVYLEGTKDSDGKRFWNATPSCCDIHGRGTDDLGYLRAAFSELKARLGASKVFIIGHSNGGFMAYRLLCDPASKIDGILSLAGADAVVDCPAGPYTNQRVVQVHGTTDGTISDQGGTFRGMKPFSSAVHLIDTWKKRLGCAGEGNPERKNYSLGIFGDESVVTHYGCGQGNRLTYVKMEKGSHIPLINANFRSDALDFLLGP